MLNRYQSIYKTKYWISIFYYKKNGRIYLDILLHIYKNNLFFFYIIKFWAVARNVLLLQSCFFYVCIHFFAKKRNKKPFINISWIKDKNLKTISRRTVYRSLKWKYTERWKHC